MDNNTTRKPIPNPTIAQIVARLDRNEICSCCGYPETTECAAAALMQAPACGA